jgi:hypothetical protein
MTRWKASGIHFAISASIGAIVASLLFFLWYPPPYFHAAGADELVLLLVGVDVVLGPLLTLIVFRAGKRGLKFDLTFIALAQSAALIYGMSVVLSSRPVFLCGYVDIFAIVSAYEIDPADQAQAHKPEFSSLSWTGPRLVGAQMPEDVEAHNKLVIAAFGGKDLDTFPQYYVDYSDVAANLVKKAHPIAELRAKNGENAAILDAWLKAHGKADNDIVWLPLHAPRDQLTMLMDPVTGQPIQALAINPYGN